MRKSQRPVAGLFAMRVVTYIPHPQRTFVMDLAANATDPWQAYVDSQWA